MEFDLTTSSGLTAALKEAGSWAELSRRTNEASSTLRSRRQRLEAEERRQTCEFVESLKELPDATEALATRLVKNVGVLAATIAHSDEDANGEEIWDVMVRLRDELIIDLADLLNSHTLELAAALDGDEELPLLGPVDPRATRVAV